MDGLTSTVNIYHVTLFQYSKNKNFSLLWHCHTTFISCALSSFSTIVIFISNCCSFFHFVLFVFQNEQISQNEKRNACQIVPQLAINQQRHGQSPSDSDFDMMLRQPDASLIAARMIEEQCHPIRNYDPQLQAFDVNKLYLSNSASAISRYFFILILCFTYFVAASFHCSTSCT